MKPMKFSLMISALAIVFFLATSAWADGRARGKHHHGYKKHYAHHYRGHVRHSPPYYKRHHHPRYYKRHYHRPRYYKSYRHYKVYRPGYGYGLHFSVFDPRFSFGFSTGGYR